MVSLGSAFSKFAKRASEIAGKWQTFFIALLLVTTWALSGFYFGFSNEIFQLFINTITTIITFLMVFLLQHSQNADTRAIQLKLDELVHATKNASNLVMKVEDLTDEQLRQIRDKLERRH